MGRLHLCGAAPSAQTGLSKPRSAAFAAFHCETHLVKRKEGPIDKGQEIGEIPSGVALLASVPTIRHWTKEGLLAVAELTEQETIPRKKCGVQFHFVRYFSGHFSRPNIKTKTSAHSHCDWRDS
jgi:hypothetical protein